jgi:hypothetical protein
MVLMKCGFWTLVVLWLMAGDKVILEGTRQWNLDRFKGSTERREANVTNSLGLR